MSSALVEEVMVDPSARYHGSLSNKDIAPARPQERHWTSLSFFSLWVGMAVNIPTYMIAASLISGGMSWSQAMWTVLLGNVIVLVPMVLSGMPGARYGIPFPVLARASFGIRGSNIPALLRAVVACGWFGIQTWIGGGAIYTMVLVAFPAAANAPVVLPAFIGLGIVPFACFMLFWAMNIGLIYKGIDSIKVLETLSAPFLLLGGVALLIWAWVNADGFGPMLEAKSKFASTGEFLGFFFPALTAMVGFWSTLSLNISDFTRYAKDQRAQVLGQITGLPTTMTFFAFIGVAVTSATLVIYGEAIWDPVVLVRHFDSPVLVFFAMFAVVIATLTTNAAANVVGPANNFSNLWPEKIDFKTGGYITGVIGILIMPWKLLADPSGYIYTWLIGYSALLGPIMGIMLVDYFIIRRGVLVVEELYRHDGRYCYSHGINHAAVIALLIGVLPNVPGFLAQVGLMDAQGMAALVSLYDYSWFIGFAVSSLVYFGMMRTAVSAEP